MPRVLKSRLALLVGTATTACLLTLGATPASADFIFNLNTPNSALSGFTGPYATVDVHLNSTTLATVTFTSLTNGGYIYLMGDGGTADLNVNGTYTLGTVTESNTQSGFNPTYISNTPGQVDGFGVFNLSLNNFDGFTDSATSVSFTLTNTSGTWGTANQVLVANANGAFAAIHAFACATSVSNPCTSSTGATATGFVSNGGSMSTPEPVSMILMGTFLFAAYALLRRKIMV